MKSFLYRYRYMKAEHSSGFKEVRKSIFITLGLLVLALLASVIWKFGFQKPIDEAAIAIPLSGALLGSLVRLFWLQFGSLPHNTIYNSYKETLNRFPELPVEVNAVLQRDLENLRVHIHDLCGSGEPWKPAERFRIAANLVKSFGRIDKYWATSTDNPYRTLAASREFYRLSAAKLETADVRRLLVFPKKQLLDDLGSDPVACQNLLSFIQWNQSGKYALRYWSKSLSELRETMHIYIGGRQDDAVLVDIAFVEGQPIFDLGTPKLIFGQAAKPDDKIEVQGLGMVRWEHGIPAIYADWFDNIWNRKEQDFECAAELTYWAKLFQLRKRIQTQMRGQSVLRGKDFFDWVVENLAASKSLLAVDVAEETAHWFEESEYRKFHEATKASADKKLGRHVRIFVIPHCLLPCIATRFVEKIVVDLLQHGVDVFFYRKLDLVENDIAAGDYIIAEDWCFYLAPNDEFKEGAVSQDTNKAMGGEELSLFQDQFERLARVDTAWKSYPGFTQAQTPEVVKPLADDLIDRLTKDA